MPRKSADNITEHRITFGNKERKIIEESSEKMAKAAKYSAISQGVGSTGILIIGGGVVAAAAFFGLGYAALSLSELVAPLADWVKDKSAAVAAGANVEKAEKELKAAEDSLAYWQGEYERLPFGPPKATAFAKVRYYHGTVNRKKVALAYAKKQQKFNQDNPDTAGNIADFILGQG